MSAVVGSWLSLFGYWGIRSVRSQQNDLISVRRIAVRESQILAHEFQLLPSSHRKQALRRTIQPLNLPLLMLLLLPPPPAPIHLILAPQLSVTRDVDGDAAARAEARAAGTGTTKAEVDATRHMATKHTIWAKLNIVMAAAASLAAAVISSGVGSSPVDRRAGGGGGGGDGGGEVRRGRVGYVAADELFLFLFSHSHEHKHEDEVAEIYVCERACFKRGHVAFVPSFSKYNG